MNAAITWLKALLGRRADTRLPTRSETQRPGQDFSMPDIYITDDSDTQPALPIIEMKLSKNDESPGFNPYDTGIIGKK